MMNNNPIGIFDSGVGGLTVLSKLLNLMPNENYIYFGDTQNLPYGSKNKNELIKITKSILDFFATKNVKAVVIACNTTSAITYELLKNDYDFKIFPIIQIASKYIANLNINRLGILATKATTSSNAYSKEIKKHNKNIKIAEQACPEWAQIVENQTLNNKNNLKLIEKYTNNLLEKNVDKIVLGCTHYPYLMNVLEQHANTETFIDPSKYLSEYIYEKLNSKNLIANLNLYAPQFFVSSNPNRFQKTSELFHKLEEPPELLSVNNYNNAFNNASII